MFFLMIACGPQTPPEPAPAAGPPALVDPALVSNIEAGFQQAEGWTLAPLVQLQREEMRAAIVWPMFDPSGEVVDDDVVGVTVDGEGRVLATNWRPEARRLVVELGGDDWKVRPRSAGVPQDLLGDEAVARSDAFRSAREAGDGPAAVQAAQDFSRLFVVDPVLDQTVTGLLVQAGGWVFVTRRPQSRTATIVLEVQGEVLELEAAPIRGDMDRWAFQ